MNIRLIVKTVGYMLLVEAGCMILPLVVSLYYGESTWRVFVLVAAVCALLGAVMARPRHGDNVLMQGRDGYVAVAAAWVSLTLFGAVPYVISGAIPRYIDAVFETVSGLTTTGATILQEIESLPKGILFWRSETQWIGGMGVLVMFLALMPKAGAGAVHLMRAESPGPIKSKIMPKVSDTAKILYCIYISLTVLEIVSLRIAGMTWFDAVNHGFTTMATGGFSVKNASIAAYDYLPGVAWVISVFTFLAGVNFALMFAALRGGIRQVFRSAELRLYVSLIVLCTVAITLNLWLQGGAPLSGAAGDAAFQVITIVTTTGYTTRDFGQWSVFCQAILVILMLPGACAGSTAGGMKLSRVLIWCKSLRRDLRRIVHPKHVSVIRIDGQDVGESVVATCHGFLVAYLLILIAGALVVSWDGPSLVESLTASITCIGNVGPGLGAVGPSGNFSYLSGLSKAVLSLEMLMGRLELMPLLVLLAPGTWRRH